MLIHTHTHTHLIWEWICNDCTLKGICTSFMKNDFRCNWHFCWKPHLLQLRRYHIFHWRSHGMAEHLWMRLMDLYSKGDNFWNVYVLFYYHIFGRSSKKEGQWKITLNTYQRLQHVRRLTFSPAKVFCSLHYVLNSNNMGLK